MESTPQDYPEMTRDELYGIAQERGIEGRSQLSKEELVEALELDDIGPDAVELLLGQHDEIRRLFSEFEQLSPRPSQKKQKLVRDVITNLMKHAQIEEQVFYPAVRDELQDQDHEVDEDLEEHHVAELLLSELDSMAPEAPRYDAKVTVLIETVTHHLEEEEEQLFPRVREEMAARRRRELGAAMLGAWQTVPTRPQLHVSMGQVEDTDPLATGWAAAEATIGTPATVTADASGETSDDVMTRSEEELHVGTEKRHAGTARLRKHVVTDHVTKTIPVQREEAVVEHEPITDANRDEAMDGPTIAEAEQEVTLHEEEPVVEKRTVPKERVRLEKDTRTERELVGGEVAHEDVEVEIEGAADADDEEIDLVGLEESRQEHDRP